MNKFGQGATRNHKGDLQVASWNFIHPDNNRRFCIIGVAHLGEQDYWSDLQKRVMAGEQAGFQIHYEMVRRGNQPAPLENNPLVLISEKLNLVSQYQGLILQPTWINTDMTVSELLDAAADRLRMQAWLDKNAKIDPDVITAPFAGFLRFVIRRLMVHISIFTARDIEKVVVDGRTDFAMNKMLPLQQDVLTIWGAAHLPRMRKLLLANGFKQIGEEWHTVVRKEWREN